MTNLTIYFKRNINYGDGSNIGIHVHRLAILHVAGYDGIHQILLLYIFIKET